MYKNIIRLLRCPHCKRELELKENKVDGEEILEGKLSCDGGHDWSIREGIIDFNSKEQKFSNNWSENYKKMDYKELDREITEKTPDNEIALREKTIKYIIDSIKGSNPNTILDIATGRGMLLTKLVEKIDKDINIICVDLSFQVLKYDRIKAKNINPNIKVNYIACDATNLPFIDNTIDMAVSLFGIANMMEFIQQGITEARRVLKENKYLLNTNTIIKNVDKVYKMVKEIKEEHGVDINVKDFHLTYEDVENGHEKGDFSSVEIITVGESVGEKNELDLIPLEGEWFANVVAKCRK